MPFPLTFVDGKVGVGVSNPDAELDVNGDVDISGTLTVGGAPIGSIAVGAFGSTPNSAGASVSGSTLTLQPASVTQPGGVSIAAQTFNGAKTFDDGVLTNSVGSATAATVTITSSVADGASAIATKINTSAALSNAAAKLLSVQNNSVEKAWIDKDGAFTTTGTISVAGQVQTQRIISNPTTDPVLLLGLVANGASAVAAVIDNIPALSTSGAKLLSIKNNSVEKAFVDKDGGITAGGPVTTSMLFFASATAINTSGDTIQILHPDLADVRVKNGNSGDTDAIIGAAGVEVPVVGQSFILKSDDGTRWKLSVANTTGVLTAVLA